MYQNGNKITNTKIF